MNIKENLTNILLGVIALTMIYDVFIKTPAPETRERARKRSSVAAKKATPAPQQQPPQPYQQELQKPKNPPTTIAFKEYEHDFGTIDQNTTNNYTFEFTNTGDKPLIIETATGSCGCTVPEYPKEPIPPGGTGKIKVEYKPGKQKGAQSKTITIIANTEPKDTRLTIKANVKEVQ